ncbi:MAG: MmgE/PrpD family protein, partial [Candidatus Rokubacteria bacterium]|nr:MmgE/PrpD family protein [Candidatus Rokubacteria bacterium]
MGATARVAEFLVKSRWEELPATAVEQAKGAILDSIGVMLAGALERPALAIQRV